MRFSLAFFVVLFGMTAGISRPVEAADAAARTRNIPLSS